MDQIVLKDNVGKILGTIKVLPDGKKELRDCVGKFLGTYDPKDNRTRDNIGVIIGYGDLLTTLLRNF